MYCHCSNITDKLKFLLSKTASSLPDMAFQTFSSAVFFLQFLQWYSTYSQTQGERETITAASAVAAPKVCGLINIIIYELFIAVTFVKAVYCSP